MKKKVEPADHSFPEGGQEVFDTTAASEKLMKELTIYRDGDARYIVERLLECSRTDKELLDGIMLPDKSYAKAFEYFFENCRRVGYIMPTGNLVYLENEQAIKLAIEYFKMDAAQEEQLRISRKQKCLRRLQKEISTAEKIQEIEVVPPKKAERTKIVEKEIDGQISLFD